MEKTENNPLHYSEYLKVSELTELQSLRSKAFGKPAHDEMLFIVIHQTYELWFKQILFELDSTICLLGQDKVEDRDMLTINHRLNRIIEIQKILVSQVDVLETMTPMDFLEFRDYLFPASGFQSGQFRMIENKLGLKPKQRLSYNNQDYKEHLCTKDKQETQSSEHQTCLFILLEKWLERIPFLSQGHFDFWQSYRQAVENSMAKNRKNIENSKDNQKIKEMLMKNMDLMEQSFQSIFDESIYERMKTNGLWRLSHKALRAALFIYLYRDEPVLQLPFHLLQNLQNIDDGFTQWRNRHAQMVHRMIGTKIGTGGSSGHKYLKATSEKHKVFQDLNNLASFFIPKSCLPPLPEEILNQLQFQYKKS